MCQNNDSVQALKCPLCQHDMPLVEIPSQNSRENKAFAWICSNCPNVAFEWFDYTDSEAFAKSLVLPTHKPLDIDVREHKYLECPCCDSLMAREIIRSNDAGKDSESVRWFCEPCPIIVVYVPEQKDKDALMSYFNGELEVLTEYNDEVFEELNKEYGKIEEESLRKFEEKYVNKHKTIFEKLQ